MALLLTGTALAQLIPLLASVVLARLYTPSDFGAYAWALSIVALATLFAGGAFGQAVNLPQEPREAAHLAWLVGLGGALVALALGLAGLGEALVFQRFVHRMWFVPAATLLLSAQNATAALVSREARFGIIVRSRLVQAGANVAVTLSGGWWHASEAGLMLGNLAGMLAGCLVLHTDRWSAQSNGPRPSLSELRATARRFAEFPRWQLPAALIDAVATQSPVWIISSFFGLDVLGQFSLATRVIGTPLQLLGASFGEVFRQQAAAEWRRTGRCGETLGHYALVLGSIHLPVVLLLALVGPQAVTAVFGDRWSPAGEMLRFLAIVYALRGSIGTLSYVLILGGRQRIVFLVHLLLLAGSASALVAAAAGSGPLTTIVVLVAANAGVYALYARLIAHTSAGAGSPLP